MASFRCYDNSDVIVTLIITNSHLYLIQRWRQFFQIFVYGDVVYAQTWRYWLWKTVSSHLNTKELKFYITITSIQIGFYAKRLMVNGSSFFLIINDVITTSIPLFKTMNVLNRFMILSTSSYFSTYNAFRFVDIFGKEWWSIWVQR